MTRLLIAGILGSLLTVVQIPGTQETIAVAELAASPGHVPASTMAPQNNIRMADRFPGSDLGAKINAADKDLGSGTGEIRVTSSGTIATPVALTPNHTLALLAATTWDAGIALANGTTITGNGAASPLTISLSTAGSFIHGADVSNVRIVNLVASAKPGKPNYDLVSVAGSGRVTVSNCKVTNMHLFASGSTVRGYGAVTDANSSHNITLTGNVATADTRLAGGAILISYTQGATISGNKIDNFDHGVQWWGGDSCVGKCVAGGNGALTNERKVQNLVIDRNAVSNVVGGIWGSMGQNIYVTNNTVTNCEDVCLDSEGGNSVTFSHNTVRDGTNGALATFWLNRDITFDDNTVTSTSSKKPLFRIHNATQNPALNRNVTLNGNQFSCLDRAICSIDSEGGPVGQIAFTRNTLKNTKIYLAVDNEHIIDVENNDLLFDISSSVPFSAIGVGRTNQIARQPGWVKIANNTVRSEATQPPGSQAIMVVQSDFNSSPVTTIQNNQLIGSHPFPIDIEVLANSANPGVTPAFVITGNTLGSGKILPHAGKTGKISVRNANNRIS